MRKTALAAALLLLAAVNGRAQFYTHGADPSHLRWYSIETPYYKIIYPQGADSLARTYGRLLEQFRVPMGRSIGMTPGERPRAKMPVVLHTHNAFSNGSVAWAPRRMDLFTIPEPYGSDPTPWEVQLASHEPRHQAQLQLGSVKGFRIGSWLFGEGFSPVLWSLYLNGPLGEGDAVAAETGLAGGTRARTADFLNYYRIAYDQGDFRTWNRWRYGSFRNYTPDYYTIGYMTVAGQRVFGDDPYAVKTALERSRKAPWLISPYNFNAGKNFLAYAEKFNDIWQKADSARAPFMPAERVTPKESFPVMYSSLAVMEDGLYALRDGYTHAAEIVRYTGGKWKSVAPFASHTSSLYPDPERGRLYWSETIGHPRWELEGKSVLRYYDLGEGKMHDLTREGRYYNPRPSADGTLLAVVEYPVDGGSAVVLVSTADGSATARFPAPEGVQATSAAWAGGGLYALSVEDGGCGLYNISKDGIWTRILEPMKAKVVDLDGNEGLLEWISDASGVNELYRYYLDRGRLVRLTNTRYGGEDFCEYRDSLYYVSGVLDGDAVMRSPLSEFKERPAKATDAFTYLVEDALTAQETAMGGVDRNMPVEFSEPTRYHKLAHPLQIHTWLPAYVDHEAIMDATFDFSYESAAPGLTLFFQNQLGTLSGALGYAVHPDPDRDKGWRNAFHGKLTYAGLYPVLEASLDIGDQSARKYRLAEYDLWGNSVSLTSGALREAPSVVSAIKAYIPLSYSKGGFLYGVTPQVSYTVSNNLYNTLPAMFKAPEGAFEGVSMHYLFSGFGDKGGYVPLQSLSASVRGYFMRPRPESRVYPRTGIGAEVGGFLRPGLARLYSPTLYGYMYGYLPGLYQTHGLKLTAMVQRQLGDVPFPDSFLRSLPRGFDGAAGSRIVNANSRQWRITADYAIPFTIGGDLSLMPLAYIRNFVATPHFDFTGFPEGNLFSVGLDLVADMGCVAAIAADTTLGITASLLGGTWFSQSGQKKTWFVGPVFDLSF